MKQRTLALEALVLKRTNTGETDRVVTLLTQEQGRMVCVAKGVRKLASSKRAHLEPGNVISAFLVSTKSLPLLTQSKLLKEAFEDSPKLADIRNITQLLETYDKLFVQEELEPYLYQKVLQVRDEVVSQKRSQPIRDHLSEIIVSLGYQHPADSKYDTITEYVSALSDRPMRSFEFLRV
ncbi:MAG: DNA repair protein RecO [Pseudomonadales bacterium]|nr:DNA repair protein RecO [Pseudomonadales bacterium]